MTSFNIHLDFWSVQRKILILSLISDIVWMKQTEKNIIEAVSSIIVNEGFSKLGVNRIAKVAGCDKVLIYRYFGGLEGLIEHWAKENDYYSFAIDIFKDKINSSDDMRSVAKDVILQQLRFVRESRMMQELILWELSGNTAFDYIRATREKNGHEIQQMIEHRLGVTDSDAKYYVTILMAAINYLVLFSRTSGMYNGVDFSAEETWPKIECAICNYIDMIFDSQQVSRL